MGSQRAGIGCPAETTYPILILNPLACWLAGFGHYKHTNIGALAFVVGRISCIEAIFMLDPSPLLPYHYRGVSLVVKAALSKQLCSFSVVAGSIPVLSILYMCLMCSRDLVYVMSLADPALV
jgi:hypothetical protein